MTWRIINTTPHFTSHLLHTIIIFRQDRVGKNSMRTSTWSWSWRDSRTILPHCPPRGLKMALSPHSYLRSCCSQCAHDHVHDSDSNANGSSQSAGIPWRDRIRPFHLHRLPPLLQPHSFHSLLELSYFAAPCSPVKLTTDPSQPPDCSDLACLDSVHLLLHR